MSPPPPRVVAVAAAEATDAAPSHTVALEGLGDRRQACGAVSLLVSSQEQVLRDLPVHEHQDTVGPGATWESWVTMTRVVPEA